MIKKHKHTILFLGNGTITSRLLSHVLNKTDKNIVVLTRTHKTDKNFDTKRLYYYKNLDDCNQHNIEMVVSCLPNDKISKRIWYSKSCIKLIKNHKPLCLEMSTLSCNFIVKWFNYILSLGGIPVEAPFTGSREGAIAGKLSVFLYTNNDYVKDFLKVFCLKIYSFTHLGEPTKFKLFYNLWGAFLLYSCKEFFPILLNEFTDTKLVKNIVKNDGWMSSVTRSILTRVEKAQFADVSFKYQYMVKDVNLALNQFSDYKLPLSKKIKKKLSDKLNSITSEFDFSYFAFESGNKKTVIKNYLHDIAKSRKLPCSIYYTGSLGRDEERITGTTKQSDVDVLVVCSNNHLPLVKKNFQEISKVISNYQKNVSFIICLDSYFTKNIYSSFHLSTDVLHPIYVGIKERPSHKIPKISRKSFCYQTPCYYYARLLANGEYIDKIKFIVETLKCYLIISKKVEIKGYFFNKYLLTHKNLLIRIVSSTELTTILNSFYLGTNILTNTINKCVKKCFILLHSIVTRNINNIKLKSVKIFYKYYQESHNSRFNHKIFFIQIRNAVFLENQGIGFKQALISEK